MTVKLISKRINILSARPSSTISYIRNNEIQFSMIKLMNYTCYNIRAVTENVILSKPKQDKKNSRSFQIGCSDFGKVTPSRPSYSSTLKRLEGTRQEDALVYEYNISSYIVLVLAHSKITFLNHVFCVISSKR
jgi:hypothetical protein